MKFAVLIIFCFFKFTFLYSENNILFYIEAAFKNNPKLNAERENFKSIKQNINISKSEFLPNLTLSGSQTSTESSNRTDQTGSALPDTNINSEKKSYSLDQKIFQGFQGYNSLKKSKLEVKKAGFELKEIEQETILNTVIAYYDLIFKNKNKKFNSANVDLFVRQVESDSVRMQKGEINLTDLAQSESSLAGSNAKLISAETELLTAKINFEKITRASAPTGFNSIVNLKINLPLNLKSSLELSELNNPRLIVARLNVSISEKELNIEKAKFSPSASLNYTKSENNNFSSTIDDNDEETVKATVTWPIIKGGKNYSSIKKSSYIYEKNKLLLKDIQNDVKTATTNAWSVYKSSKSVLEATKAQLKAAEIANEGITLEYDSGNTRTTLEVIQSRSLLLDARISYAKAERDFIISQFQLLDQIGSLSIETIKSS